MLLTVIKSGLLKKLLGFFGAAGFLMTFQACYGTPQNFYHLDGEITDKQTGEGIPNLRISCVSHADSVSALTNENGKYWISFYNEDQNFTLHVRDDNRESNELYSDFDTILKPNYKPVNIALKKVQ